MHAPCMHARQPRAPMRALTSTFLTATTRPSSRRMPLYTIAYPPLPTGFWTSYAVVILPGMTGTTDTTDSGSPSAPPLRGGSLEAGRDDDVGRAPGSRDGGRVGSRDAGREDEGCRDNGCAGLPGSGCDMPVCAAGRSRSFTAWLNTPWYGSTPPSRWATLLAWGCGLGLLLHHGPDCRDDYYYWRDS